ncbi:tyrosine-type recombinase/integrase [Parabacteroides pacaensis]|uniref:tyrosine-type recombinase/integrase n=1 Tax=Parabacteroides pacaensis TaxID=2086575 RepID=UPI000D1094DC|nr:tyrosine-type recombinase/integrase [Parabacteroides pacaensis]
MAVFATVIRGKRNDGYYPVYIRVSHGSGNVSYIKTAFVVSEKGLKKTYTKSGKEKIEVSDPRILKECMNEIARYIRKLNEVDNEKMSIHEVIQYLTSNEETDLSFTFFANEFISNMVNQNRGNSSRNYKLAIKRLHEFFGKDNILFSDLTALNLTNWIESMKDSARKRNLYPTCIKTIFNAALLQYNDEDRDLIRIKKNPFNRIKIPKNKPSEKRSIEVNVIEQFFTTPIREKVFGDYTKEQIAHDVCMLVFCLAGINTADLYDLKKEALTKDMKLCYNRKKTRDKSDYEAYTEIKVPAIVYPLLERYKGEKGLFCFSERYCDSNTFASVVAKGCKRICETARIVENVTPYSFRHSWATIAINNCGATLDDVAFSLNHASAHKITTTYIRPDYNRIDNLNNKVIKFVFGQ